MPRLRPVLGCEALEDRSLFSGTPLAAPLLADLTGDGVADLTTLAGDGRILFRRGLSDGVFAPARTLNGADTPARDLAVLPGPDGPLLAALPLTPAPAALELYAYDPAVDGFVQRPGPALPAGASPVCLSAADLGDGQQALVVLDAQGEALVYPRQDGAFAAPHTLDLVGAPSAMLLSQLAGGSAHALIVPTPAPHFFANRPVEPSSPVRVTVSGQYLAILDDRIVSVLHAPEGDVLGRIEVPATASDAVLGTWEDGSRQWLAVLDPAARQVLVYVPAQPGSWTLRARLDVGPSPTGLSVEHHEGHDDLLVSQSSGDVLRLACHDDLTFEPWRNVMGGIALAVQDLDRPGGPEFVFADQGLDRVALDLAGRSTLLGDARAGMEAPAALRLADLNGDGIPDLVVCDSGADRVDVYLGLGDGRFGPEINGGQGFPTGVNPLDVAILRLPGGGVALLVADEGSGDVTELLGRGKGAGWTLVQGPRLRVGRDPTSVVLGDVNGDGLPDLVATNSGDNNVSILTGIAPGEFDDAAPRILPVGAQPRLSLLGDFSGDGGVDLVTLDMGSNDLTFYADVGSPGSVARTIATGGQGPIAALALGNGELVVANYLDGRLSLLQGGPNGLTLTEVYDQPGTHPMALAAASGLGVWVADEGQAGATLVRFDQPESIPRPSTPAALLVEERTGAPEALLAPEGGSSIDLQPLTPTTVGLVPTLVTGTDSIGRVGGVNPRPETSVPDTAEVAGREDDQASVHRFVLGTDDVPPPRLDEGAARPARPVNPLDEVPLPPVPGAEERDVQLEPLVIEGNDGRWSAAVLALFLAGPFRRTALLPSPSASGGEGRKARGHRP